MMYGWGWDNNGGGDHSLFGFLLWLAVLVDLVLLGVWLWQKVQKNK